jgi:hypothetical protein
LVACSGKPAAESPSGGGVPGREPETPIVTCGPQESYAYVAQRFRGADGSNPLGGDIARGQQARRGSQGAPQGEHILDVYDVSCPEGMVTLYIDMYGCPEYEKMLQQSREGTAQGSALQAAFLGGKFEQVVAHCRELAPGAPHDERIWCSYLTTASLYALKRDSEALSNLTENCTNLHEATPHSDARAQHLAMVFVALAEAAQRGKFESTEEQRSTLIDGWLEACSVPAEQLRNALESMSSE